MELSQALTHVLKGRQFLHYLPDTRLCHHNRLGDAGFTAEPDSQFQTLLDVVCGQSCLLRCLEGDRPVGALGVHLLPSVPLWDHGRTL